MHKRAFNIIIAALIALMLLSGILMASASASDTAKLVFSGVTMMAQDDGSVQGFLDIKVSNVENAGVGFVLEYDSDYVELSNAADNSAGTQVFFMGECPYIKWNTRDFAPNTFNVRGQIDKSDRYVKAELDIVVSPDAVGDNIELRHDVGDGSDFPRDTKIVNASGKTLTLGGLSFNIKDPAAFAKLSREELSNIFRVGTNVAGDSLFSISYVDTTSYPPIVFYDTNSHLGYEFEVNNAISSVTVNHDNQTTNAAVIFNGGTQQDLLDWLNLNMQDVEVTYADGTKIGDTVNWRSDAEGFAISPNYDLKGGVYTVEQNYNEEVKVKATVTVKPVTVLGYTSDKAYRHYNSVNDLPQSSDPKVYLDVPDRAAVLFDTVVPGKTDLTVTIGDTWRCDVYPPGSDFFFIFSGVDGQYEYSTEVTGAVPAWATEPDGLVKRVTIVRVMGAVTPQPQIIKAEVSADGWLTVTANVPGVDDLTGYDFPVRLPGGVILDHAKFTNADGGGYYEVAASGDTATIRLKAENMDEPQQAALRQAINLGRMLGGFGLAAKSPDKPQSDWAMFDTDPRRNVYLGAQADGTGDYSFDYSAVPQVFSIDADTTTLPLSIALAQGNSVGIIYSAQTGLEPGRLTNITVESWELTDGVIEVGKTATFTGKLADNLYADQGMVYNDNDISVSITVMVTDPADKPDERIKEIEDIVFDKMSVGYDTLQTKMVEIENIGLDDINGLTITITPDDTDSAAAFTLSASPAYLLSAGDKLNCQITRRLGLAEGTYGATINIGSNRNATLQSFHVSVEITNKEVYTLNVVANPDTAGTARALDGANYVEGDTVRLEAQALEDCEFVGWKVTQGPNTVIFDPSDTDQNATFEMPNMDLYTEKVMTVEAMFTEGPGAVLRLQELHFFNPDDTENDLLKLGDNLKYVKTEFAPLTRDGYYVIAPGSADKNHITFKFAPPEDADVEVFATLQVDADPEQTLTVRKDDAESDLYHIDEMPIVQSPAVNRLVITLTRHIDGEDDIQKTYTVDVMRKLTVDQMVTMNYGNSPFGLIMKQTGLNATQREEWKQAFREAGSRFTEGYTPDGAHAGIAYHPDAWGDTAYNAAVDPDPNADHDIGNYDRNDYALFAYCGDNFTDPGLRAVKDSLGATVQLTEVRRSIKDINALVATDPKNLVDDFQQGQPRSFDLGSDMESAVLADQRIRPGVYFITYEFDDYNGEKVSVNRPFIVLYDLGDVDMNGQVDDTDAALIANRYNSRLPYDDLPGYESNCRLYQYRICDVNRDRNINVGDRNAIRQQKSSLVQFYK